MKTQKTYLSMYVSLIILYCSALVLAGPMSTAFTYQGRLLDAGEPANGTYDMQFKLFTGTGVPSIQLGTTLLLDDVPVEDGYFTVLIDFGVGVFGGGARYLEIGCRPGSSTGSFTTLSPRIELTAVPYALQTRGIYVNDALNVGVGTVSPTGKLHITTESIYGDIVFFDAGSAQNDLSVDPDSSYTDTLSREYIVQVTSASGSPDLFRWSDDNGATWSLDQLQMTTEWYALSYGVRIKWDDVNGHVAGDTWAWFTIPREANALVVKNGKVGVGTSNPAWKLEVANARAGESAKAGVSADDAGGAIAAYSSTYSAYPHFADRVSVFSDELTATGLDLRADGSDSDIRFYTGGIENSNLRMRITSGGNIGIGTSSPGEKLDVVGSIQTTSHFIADGNNNSGLVMKENGATKANVYWNTADDFLGLAVDGLDKLVIKSGRVGIGTTSPGEKLDVVGSIKASGPENTGTLGGGTFGVKGECYNSHHGVLGISYESTGTGVYGGNSGTGYGIWGSSQTGTGIRGVSHGSGAGVSGFSTSGNAIYGESIFGLAGYFEGDVHVDGNITYTGSISDVSDIRLKENIAPLKGGIEKISSLKAIYFNNKGESIDHREVGVIAQDVEKVLPELVLTDKDGYKSVDYTKLTPVLIEAVKEQQQQIEALQAEIIKLKNQNRE